MEEVEEVEQLKYERKKAKVKAALEGLSDEEVFAEIQTRRTGSAEHAQRAADWHPATDVYRTRDGWLIKFELAGVQPEDIDLTVQGRMLRVRGTRRDTCWGEECRQVRVRGPAAP